MIGTNTKLLKPAAIPSIVLPPIFNTVELGSINAVIKVIIPKTIPNPRLPIKLIFPLQSTLFYLC